MKDIEHFKSSINEKKSYGNRSGDFAEPKKYPTVNLNGSYTYNRDQDMHSQESKSSYPKRRELLIFLGGLLLLIGLIFTLFYISISFRENMYSRSAQHYNTVGQKSQDDRLQRTIEPLIFVDKIGQPLGSKLCISNSDERGLLIGTITEDGPADQAGLLTHDLILYLDETKINTAQDAKRFLEDKIDGDLVRVKFLRNGEKLEVSLKLDID